MRQPTTTTTLEQSRAALEMAKFEPLPGSRTTLEIKVVELVDWERRLLEKVRLLRQGGNSAMLTVMWDGQAMLFWDGNPSGKMIAK